MESLGNIWATPRRQGLSALGLMTMLQLWRSIKRLFPFIAIVIFFRFTSDKVSYGGIWYILLLASIISPLKAIYDYIFLTYSVSDGHIHLHRTGLFARKLSIPLSKVYQLKTEQSFAFGLVDMELLQFESLGGGETEIELCLPSEEVGRLKGYAATFLTEKVVESSPDVVEEDAGDEPGVPYFTEHRTRWRMRLPHLIRSVVSCNPFRGILVAVGMVLGLVADYVDTLIEHYDNIINTVEDWLPTFSLNWGLVITLILLTVALMVQAVSLILRQYDLQVTVKQGRMECSGGLLNRYSYVFRASQVIVCTVRRTPLERLFGLSSLRIKFAEGTAATEGKERKKAEIRIEGVSHEEVVTPLLAALYPHLDAESIIETRPTRAFAFACLRNGGAVVLLLISAAYYYEFYRLVILTLGLLILALYSILSYRRYIVSVSEHYQQLNHGALTHKRTIVPHTHIESVWLRQSFIQKWRGSAHLCTDTKSAPLMARYLPESRANAIRDLLLYLSSSAVRS